LLALRKAPMRWLNLPGLPAAFGRQRQQASAPRAPIGLPDFTQVAQRHDEIVYGFVGRFWLQAA